MGWKRKRWKFKRKMETLRKNQKEVLEFKIQMSEMKNLSEEFNHRLATAQKRNQ